jgi:hypothetical protein
MQQYEAVVVCLNSSILTFTVARDILCLVQLQDYQSCFMQTQLILREM